MNGGEGCLTPLPPRACLADVVLLLTLDVCTSSSMKSVGRVDAGRTRCAKHARLNSLVLEGVAGPKISPFAHDPLVSPLAAYNPLAYSGINGRARTVQGGCALCREGRDLREFGNIRPLPPIFNLSAAISTCCGVTCWKHGGTAVEGAPERVCEASSSMLLFDEAPLFGKLGG